MQFNIYANIALVTLLIFNEISKQLIILQIYDSMCGDDFTHKDSPLCSLVYLHNVDRILNSDLARQANASS